MDTEEAPRADNNESATLTSTMDATNTTPTTDTTPSSSSDANNEITSLNQCGVDHISSTSDEVDRMNIETEPSFTTCNSTSLEMKSFADDIEDVQVDSEITENVEDIANDLENLLDSASESDNLLASYKSSIVLSNPEDISACIEDKELEQPLINSDLLQDKCDITMNTFIVKPKVCDDVQSDDSVSNCIQGDSTSIEAVDDSELTNTTSLNPDNTKMLVVKTLSDGQSENDETPSNVEDDSSLNHPKTQHSEVSDLSVIESTHPINDPTDLIDSTPQTFETQPAEPDLLSTTVEQVEAQVEPPQESQQSIESNEMHLRSVELDSNSQDTPIESSSVDRAESLPEDSGNCVEMQTQISTDFVENSTLQVPESFDIHSPVEESLQMEKLPSVDNVEHEELPAAQLPPDDAVAMELSESIGSLPLEPVESVESESAIVDSTQSEFPVAEVPDSIDEPMEVDEEDLTKEIKTDVTEFEFQIEEENQYETDPEAELVKAALEASYSNIDNEIEKQDNDESPVISDEDVIRAAMDCRARNEEDIKAAQEVYEDDAPSDVKEEGDASSKEDDASSSSPLEDSVSNIEHMENERVRLEEFPQKVVHEYQKPLNIVVDPPSNEDEDVNPTESGLSEVAETKESSDDDKPEEYSSKISQSQELKLTIRKTKAEESSILKIYDPKEPVPEISPSESETEAESPLPKLVIKQSQLSPKVMSPLKITFKSKSMVKPEEQPQKASPKLIIKPIIKPEEELHHSPKITIKPIPIPEDHERSHSPKITIKPLIKPQSEACVSPKIKIKPIVKPEEEAQHEEERIVLKISKNRDIPTTPKSEESEKLGKIKLKFSMGSGHAHIVNEAASDEPEEIEPKRLKLDDNLNESIQSHQGTSSDIITPEPVTQIPKRRGRPRKVPLEVRADDEEPVLLKVRTSSRLKRTRGPSARDTLGIKPRKPRERGRGRGGRGRGAKAQETAKSRKQKRIESKLKVIKEAALTAELGASFEYHRQEVGMKCVSDDDACVKSSNLMDTDKDDNKSDVVMYEEETRMSADSRAQTPAKQIIVNPIVGESIAEESQSSVQSTATTESAKAKKIKMEVEPEGAIISADQLTEYYWGGSGPYMLQEQVAQFLGIKSFKRKYPAIPRRPVDMQERDFIRESGLASEHMCDLGLTAVNSADILDLMYSDFQHKYEEYCKHQRDRQTKDITNKQKALSLAASQEKNKIDIMQQAVESAAQWNANFNKTRREERRACMDLQTFTINYPKGKLKQVNRPKIGHYPISLVPGQYTDYYKTYTPTELNNLPLNTMLYHQINCHQDEDSQSDGSGSESESTSSGTDSSDSESSDDDCNICSPPPLTNKRIYT